MRHTRFRAGDRRPRTWAATATRDVVEPIGVVDYFFAAGFGRWSVSMVPSRNGS